MLLFLGGAARTGKSMLSRRLLREQQFSYLSLDVLGMGLKRGAPTFAIDPDAGGFQVAETLWPLVHQMSYNLLAEGVKYIFEGEILPKHVAILRQEHPKQLMGCFLGYTQITAQQKLLEVRAHAGHPNDWPQTYSDSALLQVITREIAFSQYIREECAHYDFRYFDTSYQFNQVLDEVAAYVQSG